MISFIKGRVEYLNKNCLCIDVNGIGYRVFTSTAGLERVAPGQTVKLYTRMIVREDSMSIFGFIEKEELYLFERLITVSGIGPKVALAILSSMPPREFAGLVVGERIKELMGIPGIGRKTGERLILELRDKLDIFDVQYSPYEPMQDKRREALEALMSLGFDANTIRDALSKVDDEGADTPQLIKLCLKFLKS